MEEPVRDFLSTLPHFGSVPPDLMEKIAAQCRLARFENGQLIFAQGDRARAFYAIRAGAVRVYRSTPDGREQVLHHLHAGQTFAEAALLSFGAYPAFAAAIETPTELVEIGGGFVQLFRDDPRLAAAMVSSLSMWLFGLVERIEELSIASAPARLARYLLKLPARGAKEPYEIELPMAKKELAAHLAIAPETLSRLLRRWQDAGLVRSKGRDLELVDARVLAAIADRDEG
jgi:CRP/FNR family transcriptional regulator